MRLVRFMRTGVALNPWESTKAACGLGSKPSRRTLVVEVLESRLLLSVQPSVQLPDPTAYRFDGPDNVSYNGPVAVTGIDVSNFSAAASGLSGQESAMKPEVGEGTVTVEIVSPPVYVRKNEPLDIEVRIKFEGNSRQGPWQVENLGLYDKDFLFDDKITEVSDPLQIQSLGTWYNYTFTGVDLAAFDDDGDGLELYAYGKVDDKVFNGFSPTDSSDVSQIDVWRTWSVMVYLDGDCNLEGEALDDFNEMVSVGSSSDVGIVAQFDRHPSANIFAGYGLTIPDWSNTRRGVITSSSYDGLWGTAVPGDEMDMGAPNSVSSFVTWVKENHPADHYALVFWDHGGGAIDGVCFDDSSGGDAIQTSELEAALSTAGHLDLIGFDACLMGMEEVAYQIRSFGDVMVASEELEPGSGWAYDQFLADLVADPAMDAATLGRHIVDTYGATVGSDETLAAIDLDQVAPLATSLDAFATLMLTTATVQDWNGVLTAHDATRRFGGPSADHFQYYDVGEWMVRIQGEQVSGDVKTAASAVKSALDSAVMHRYPAASTNAYGLSIYAPFAELNARYDPNYDGNDIHFVADTRWEEFVGPIGIDVVTVIDRSGSMEWENRIVAAKAAARQFIDLMNTRDKLGVVSYTGYSILDFPLTEIDAAGTVKNQAAAAVDAIYPIWWGTSIGAGVQTADGQLDRFPNDRVRAMLVLTDGQENTSPWAMDVINSQVDPNILIYTVGFGSDADAGLLTQMATARSGQYYDGNAVNLSDIYFALAGHMAGRQPSTSTSRTIQQGEEVRLPVPVESCTDRTVFGINWQGSDMDLTLIAPDGTIIDSTTPAANPYVSFESGPTYEFFTVELPMRGEWQMVVKGVNVPSGGETVNLHTSTQSPVNMTISSDSASYRRGQHAHLQAELGDLRPILGASVVARVAAPSGSARDGEQITLYDDGAHGDGAANDGMYANDSGHFDLVGSYTFSVDADGTSYFGDAFARHSFLSVVVAQAPTIAFTALNAAPDSVDEGETITLTGTFASQGSQAPQVTVDWGDGSGAQTITLGPADRSFSIPHGYAANPDAPGTQYAVQVSVSDDWGYGGNSVAVTVENVAPQAGAVSGPGDVVPYQPFLLVTDFTDAGVQDTHHVTIDWGDGSPLDTTGTVQESNGSGTATGIHAYSALGTYTVHVVVQDNDGAAAPEVTKTVTVGQAVLASDPDKPDQQSLFVGGTSGNDKIAVTQKGRVKFNVAISNLKYSQTFQPSAGGRLYVYAGPGDDGVKYTGSREAVLVGGDGNDALFGGSKNDALYGEAGNDSLVGGAGHDVLVGGEGDDTLAGGPGNDTYAFDAGLLLGSDKIIEKSGIDTLDFSPTTTAGVTVDLSQTGPQAVVPDNFVLTLSPANAIENAIGGALADALTGNKAANRLEGGAGNDTLVGGAGQDTLVGGLGDDVLTGGSGNDVYAFNAGLLLGSDMVTEISADGIDTLDFSSTATVGVTVDLSTTLPQTIVPGALVLTLSAGNVIEDAVGGGGDDVLIGNALDNALSGGPGNDTYWFDPNQASGTDTVIERPGGGTDTLDFSAAAVGVTVNLAAIGKQTVVSGNLVLTLSADNVVENVLGGSRDDVLIGNASANVLHGGRGNDVLLGGAGDDTLLGGPATGDGRDVLFAGSGQDMLWGASADDLLFGGKCAFHNEKTGSANLAAFNAILAEWTSTHSYSDRIQYLFDGGGLNKKTKLKGNLLADSAIDTLYGEGEQDWFLVRPEDLTPDFDPLTETRTSL